MNHDGFKIAVHEAGHAAAGEYFGFSADSLVINREGICVCDGDATDWQKGVFAASGWVAEGLIIGTLIDIPQVSPLKADTVRQWANEILAACKSARHRPQDYSDLISNALEPRACIEASFRILSIPDRRAYIPVLARFIVSQSARTPAGDGKFAVRAFQIARQGEVHARRAAEYEQFATELLSIPMPPSFPAELGDFLAQIVAPGETVDGETARRFSRFGLHEEQTTGWSRSNCYEFANKDLWRDAVRRYRRWLEKNQA